MITIHRFAKLAGSVAIAAMIVPAHSFAASSGGAGGAGTPSSTTPGAGAGGALSPGAPPQAETQAPVGTVGGRKRVRAGAVTPETSGGSSREGASGSTMENCMAAWDEKTHMTQDRWRETCQRTLDEKL